MSIKISVEVSAVREDKDFYRRILNAVLDAVSDVMGEEGGAEELLIQVEKEEPCRVFGVYDVESNAILGYIEVCEEENSAQVKVTLSV